MPALHPDSSPSATAPAAQLAPSSRLALLALATLPAVAALASGLTGADVVAIAAAVAAQLAGAGVAVIALRRDYPHATLGLCNGVTLVRLGLSSALIAPLFADASGWALIAVALTALALDGLDGWLARREDRVSAFGARFDMEVDAALGLVLA
ncbi:MAG: CDP-alcohol phosphatidyltransferase family protein, partial [Pseudomonadales bacterium]|nr:CDP-alcohol phosphatidyltransferase family protein [Pseudomonadales bacterium]